MKATAIGTVVVLGVLIPLYWVAFIAGFIIPDPAFQLDPNGLSGPLTREAHFAYSGFWVVPGVIASAFLALVIAGLREIGEFILAHSVFELKSETE